MKFNVYSLLFAAVALPLSVGVATAQRGGGERNGPPKPPAEALTACEQRAAGDTCKFTVDDRAIEGVCRPNPRDESAPLACVPDRGGPPPGDGGGGSGQGR